MAKVDINTKMITLLGDPLKQSFAAQMQNCGYEAAGLNLSLIHILRHYKIEVLLSKEKLEEEHSNEGIIRKTPQ